MDNEVSGNGNSYTAMFWEYDSRLGRRWNTDLITYPWQSPYATFNNNPIVFNDPLGLQGDPKTKPVNGGTLSTVEVSADGGLGIEPIKPTLLGSIPQPDIEMVLKAPQPLDPEVKQRISFSNKDYFKKASNGFPYKNAGRNDDWIQRFAEFKAGGGTTNMLYGPDHKFTKGLQNGSQVNQARDAFYNKYHDDFVTGKFNNQASLTRFDSDFTPFAKGTNMYQEFVGTCKINIFTSKDAQRLIIVVANTTGKRSFYYHLPGIKDVPRTSAWGGPSESTLLNLYIWSEPISTDKFGTTIPQFQQGTPQN